MAWEYFIIDETCVTMSTYMMKVFPFQFVLFMLAQGESYRGIIVSGT